MSIASEGLYHDVNIKYLEEGISKQLTERNFIFNTVKAFHQFDICELMDDFLIEIDGNNLNNRIIVRYSVPQYEDKTLDEIINDVCDDIIEVNPNRVKYRKYKVYCQHCGAPIQTNEEICPYCEQPYTDFNFKEDT